MNPDGRIRSIDNSDVHDVPPMEPTLAACRVYVGDRRSSPASATPPTA